MKTKSVLLAVLMSASVVAFANEPADSKVAIVDKKQGLFKVIYEGEKSGSVKMNILNSAGTVVFEETVNNISGFARSVNFNGMADGEYTIEVIDASGKQVQKVSYEAYSIAKYAHVAKTAEDKYLFTIANSGTKKVNVKIYDNQSNLIHNENVTINGNFGQVYDLKNFTGIPTFEVTTR